MSYESNVAGFLGMSSRDDGTGSFSPGYGGLNQRKANRHKHYYKSTYGIDLDPETGEILNYKPPKKNMAYARRGNFNVNRALNKLPNPSTLLNIGVLGLIAFGGYKIYKMIAPSASDILNTSIDDAKREAAKQVGTNYVDTAASKTLSNVTKANELASKGLEVGSLHTNNANYLHSLMNKAVVDHVQVIKTVKGMSIPTLQLVSAAYGNRELPNYRDNITHIFNPAVWSNLFSDKKLLGTLKDHLTLVLSDSEAKTISSWLSKIS